MVYGYKTYKCDDGYIITRLSREKINILMEDEQDGIEAREIVKGVYVFTTAVDFCGKNFLRQIRF